MGNRKVKTELFTSPLKAELSRPLLPQPIGWTESSTSSLAETPWPPCAIYFSVSPCLHSLTLFILSPLQQFKPAISSPIHHRHRLVLLQKPVFLKMPLHISFQSEELRILQLSLTGHAFPTPLIRLAIPVHPALPPTCGARNWAPHSGWGLANALQRGRIASHVLWDALLFRHQNMTFAFS